MEEDYQRVTAAAGHLQQKVHNLEEEIREMKLKADIDNTEKEKAEIKYEELQMALDQEGVPQCPICNKRFTNIDVLKGHMDIIHPEIDNPVLQNQNYLNEDMENSEQDGYGTTEEY